MRAEPGSDLRSSLATGTLLGASALPGPFGPLAFVGMLPLLRRLAAGPAPGRAAASGFLAGLVFFGIAFGWVPLARAGGGLALSAAYLLALPVLAAVFAGFAALVAAVARASPLLALAAAPGGWVALEFARSQEWVLAVPWAHLGYALADWPLLSQGAAIGGLYGLSLWIVAVNAGLAAWPRLPAAARVAATAVLLAPIAPGLALRAGETAAAGRARLRVAAVQPAIPEARRHQPRELNANLDRLLALSARALASPAELLAWPESAYERVATREGDAFLGVIAQHLGTPVVTGAWRGPEPGRAWTNGALLADRGRTRWVAEKVHPVPVYERVADGAVASGLARLGLWSGRFERGAPPQPVLVRSAAGGSIPVGVLVCIDASHPELARRLRASGARLLVAIANEAGTGAWSAALHARATRLRAVENRIPVVRVANTGPSLWIDEHGRVTSRLAAGSAGAGAEALALAGPPPLSVALGDGPLAGCAAAGSLAALSLSRMRRRRVVASGHPPIHPSRKETRT
jgi:apolipoprotein N-acyltransferase